MKRMQIILFIPEKGKGPKRFETHSGHYFSGIAQKQTALNIIPIHAFK